MKFLVLVTMFLIMTIGVLAQTVKISTDCRGKSPCVDYSQTFLEDGRTIGNFIYSSVSKASSQTYGGLVWRPLIEEEMPIKSFEVGAGPGIQSGQGNLRFGGYAIAAINEQWGVEYYLEQGGGGPWHKLQVTCSYSDRWTLKAFEKSDEILGVTAKYHLTDNAYAEMTFPNKGKVGIAMGYNFPTN